MATRSAIVDPEPRPGEHLWRPAPEALGAKMRAGATWKTASQATSFTARTLLTVILAHLLTPHELGIAGMVLVFSGLIVLLTDAGFSAGIIQRMSLTDEDVSTAFWTGLAIGIVLFAIAYAVAPYVADFYGEPSVRWMFVVLSTGFLTGALIATQTSLLSRAMNFRALEIRGMAATIVSSVVAIVSAVAGAGAWSLIFQSATFSVVSVVTIWAVSHWKPRFVFSLASLHRLGSFSTKVLFSRLLAYGDRNLDNVIVGRALGPAALGIYALGYSVILVPFSRLVLPVQSIFTPAFASVQDDLQRVQALWLRASRLLVAVMLPTMLGVIVVAHDLVGVVFGARWSPATPVVQMLAWVALVQSVTVLNGPIYQSRDRVGLLLRITLLACVVDVVGFVVGVYWGVSGVAAAYAIANTALVAPVSLFLTLRLLDLDARRVIRELRGVLDAGLVMLGATLLLQTLLEALAVPPAGRLVAVVTIGAVSYAAMCWWRARAVVHELTPRRPRPASV